MNASPVPERDAQIRILFDAYSVGILFSRLRRDSPDAIKFVRFADYLEFSNSFLNSLIRL